MDQRQQPSRLARKRMSEDLETDDLDEMDDLQARLDRILGSDSGSEYTPDKDSQSYDEDDDDPRETKNKDNDASKEKKNKDEEEDEAMSDDSEIEQMKKDQRRRLNEIITDRAPKPNKYELKTPSIPMKSKSDESGENVLSFEELRRVPSLVKECLDPLQKNILYMAKQKAKATADGKSFSVNVSEKTYIEDIKKHLKRLMVEDPGECCATLTELMKLPKELFIPFIKDSRRGKDSQYNFEREALGKIALELIPRMLKIKTLQMENILKIGVCGRSWRNYNNGRTFNFNVSKAKSLGAWRRIPFTMTGAARKLLEGGDLDRLEELFEVYETSRNQETEAELEFMRSVTSMISILLQLGSQVDTLSLGGSSSVTGVGGGRGLDPETIIVNINTRIRTGGDVDWVMPLFSAFLLEEKSAEEVKEMLTGYRDQYPDHLPAHEHLLDFLHQEYSDDPDVILPHLKYCLEKFPSCLGYALRYSEMLIKSLEDDDLDESFESEDSAELLPSQPLDSRILAPRLRSREKQGLERSNEEDSRRWSCREPDVHKEIVKVLVSYLDYRTTSDNLTLWTYLTESLKYLCQTTLQPQPSGPVKTESETETVQEESKSNYRNHPSPYADLITLALKDKAALTVSGIYDWITENFPDMTEDNRWKNRVRLNLTRNPKFRKVGRDKHWDDWVLADESDLQPHGPGFILQYQYPEVSKFTRDLFEERMGWWTRQNFRNEAACSDEVIVKKSIICALLHGCENQKFKAMSQNIENRKKSKNSSFFGNLAKELDLVVPRLAGLPPLLLPNARPVKIGEMELEEEWAKIKKIKSQLEPQGTWAWRK